MYTVGADKKAGHEAASTATEPLTSHLDGDDMAPTKRSTSPAFQFYPKDFMSSSKVLRMSNTEVGIYTKLLCVCWLDNGLPTDLTALARIAGMPLRQFGRAWSMGPLRECFHERGGLLYNDRLDRERKAQADHRKKQKANADKRWESHRNATAVPDYVPPRQSGGNALQSASASPSSSADVPPPKNGGGTARARAPLHDTSHKKHVHCGRVCVHSSQHDAFVRRRNHLQADQELRDFYTAIDDAWSTPPLDTVEPGDPFDFWRARYDERWPAPMKAAARRPAEQQPQWEEWICPHVEEHLSRWRCDQATALGKPVKVSA